MWIRSIYKQHKGNMISVQIFKALEINAQDILEKESTLIVNMDQMT